MLPLHALGGGVDVVAEAGDNGATGDGPADASGGACNGGGLDCVVNEDAEADTLALMPIDACAELADPPLMLMLICCSAL